MKITEKLVYLPDRFTALGGFRLHIDADVTNMPEENFAPTVIVALGDYKDREKKLEYSIALLIAGLMPAMNAHFKGVRMKTPRSLYGFLAVAVFLLAACTTAPPTGEPTATQEQPPLTQPTFLPPTLAPVTLTPAEPTPTQPQYAPFCETAPSGCEAPVVTMLDNSYCVEKVPYAIMSVPAGTTYKSEDLEFQCRDQMHSDGTMRVTCHSVTGRQLWSFNLQVCNSSCSASPLRMETGQCPEGYGYDQDNLCCSAPAPASSDGCTNYKVDLGACSVSP